MVRHSGVLCTHCGAGADCRRTLGLMKKIREKRPIRSSQPILNFETVSCDTYNGRKIPSDNVSATLGFITKVKPLYPVSDRRQSGDVPAPSPQARCNAFS